jgi:hypothetical protein
MGGAAVSMAFTDAGQALVLLSSIVSGVVELEVAVAPLV